MTSGVFLRPLQEDLRGHFSSRAPLSAPFADPLIQTQSARALSVGTHPNVLGRERVLRLRADRRRLPVGDGSRRPAAPLVPPLAGARCDAGALIGFRCKRSCHTFEPLPEAIQRGIVHAHDNRVKIHLLRALSDDYIGQRRRVPASPRLS